MPLAQLAIVQRQSLIAHRPTADEPVLLHYRLRVGIPAMTVVPLTVACCIGAGDLSVVDDDGIRQVDTKDVSRRVSIAGHIHFMRREREPSDATVESLERLPGEPPIHPTSAGAYTGRM